MPGPLELLEPLMALLRSLTGAASDGVERTTDHTVEYVLAADPVFAPNAFARDRLLRQLRVVGTRDDIAC